MTILDRPAIVQSQQVWVCDTCGTQDHKSCSCNSSARMEELAARAEHKRQADRDRQRTKRAVARRDAENTDEFDDRPDALPTRLFVNDNGRMRKATNEEADLVFATANTLANPAVQGWEKADENQRSNFVNLYRKDLMQLLKG